MDQKPGTGHENGHSGQDFRTMEKKGQKEESSSKIETHCQKGQCFSEFLANLQAKADVAELNTLTVDDLLTFRIVCSLSDKDLRTKALRETDLTLKSIKAMGRAYEAGSYADKSLRPNAALSSTSAKKVNVKSKGKNSSDCCLF